MSNRQSRGMQYHIELRTALLRVMVWPRLPCNQAIKRDERDEWGGRIRKSNADLLFDRRCHVFADVQLAQSRQLCELLSDVYLGPELRVVIVRRNGLRPAQLGTDQQKA